ncbi:unannotated protein [freshwater metagenome]|uniref:Unannotated protein n=1 Tax=freshwater metagenome TaxID=449393 RepID=A0A6J6C9S7_9ZZZZ
MLGGDHKAARKYLRTCHPNLELLRVGHLLRHRVESERNRAPREVESIQSLHSHVSELLLPPAFDELTPMAFRS